MSLVISDLSKSRHGTPLLDEVNLELRSGAIHGLLGRNGAGKSTLLNIIAGRLVADAGSVSFDGDRMTDDDGIRARLMLMDETWPYPAEWRLRSVFRLIARRYGGFDDALAGRMMRAFGLRPDARFMRLSTGQRAAAKLVAALCAPTDVVMLDEPVDGLDAASRDLCYRFMVESYGDRPRTMIVSTHLVAEVEGLIEHAVILDHGRVLESFDMDELGRRGRLLSGPAGSVRRYLTDNGLQTLSETMLGGLLTVGVRGVPSAPPPEDVAMSPFDLNEYVIQITGMDKGCAS